MRVALAIALAIPAAASAQPAVPPELDAPWADAAPRVDGERVIAAALGMPDERLGRLAARRASARQRGEERARRAIHAWADEALASVRAGAATASAVHRAIDAHARIARVRALSDGGAVIEVEIALDALRGASAGIGGLPWSV